MIEVLRTLFHRDLQKLKAEIAAYQDESRIWLVSGVIANSGGNLCLHLIGNLNTYLGAEIGKTGYVRDRPLEFSRKDVPREELLRMLDDTIAVVNHALDQLQESDLQKEYPLLVFAEKTSTEYFLVHLTTHLAYHLGQINYHRRILDLVKAIP